MLCIRDALPEDEAEIFQLLEHYKETYLQTGETLSQDWVHTLLQHEPVWALVNQTDNMVIGVVWWEHLLPGITATIHLLIKPTEIKHFLRQNLGEEIIQRARHQWNLRSIQAIFEAKRTRPVHWLMRHAFEPDPAEWDEWIEEGNVWIHYKRMVRFFKF